MKNIEVKPCSFGDRARESRLRNWSTSDLEKQDLWGNTNEGRIYWKGRRSPLGGNENESGRQRIQKSKSCQTDANAIDDQSSDEIVHDGPATAPCGP